MIIKMPGPADRPQMAAIWHRAFGDPIECIDAFFATGFAPTRCRIAWEEGVVGAAYWFDLAWQGGRYALLYALAVDPTRQGRGIGSKLVASICAELKEQGYAGAVLVPGNESLYGYYKKLGFTAFGNASVIKAQGEGKLACLREVGWDEYLQGREGFAWDAAYGAYLGSQCRLYRGEGIWVMCYRQGEDVQEYLGPREQLPNVLLALGMKNARVRVSGGKTPAGMCLLFEKRATLPAYLGPMLD